MHHHRILSRDEWLPARGRRLSREREIARRRDQLNAERARNAASPAFDLADWVRHDEYEEDRKERASAA